MELPEKHLCARFVTRYFTAKIIWQIIWELMQAKWKERKSFFVNIVKKSSMVLHCSIFILELTQGRNHIPVICALRDFHQVVPWRNTEECTQERGPMLVKSVITDLPLKKLWIVICAPTQVKNLILANFAASLLSKPLNSVLTFSITPARMPTPVPIAIELSTESWD
jgi:hypothetical protein